MRWWLAVASLWLLVAITIPNTQAKSKPRIRDGEIRQGKRKKDGRGLLQNGTGRSKPMKIRLVPSPSVPIEATGNQGNVLSLQSYKNLQEQHATYNVIPGKQGHCVYQGLTMFDQAVWSPKPCVTCLCSRGRMVCDEISCPVVNCHFPFTPAGQCCPVCMEPVPSDPSESVTPLTHEEIQRILWREEEEHREEEEQLRKKEEARKKKRKERKEQEERQRKIVEEKRRQEEEALRLKIEKEEEEWRREMEEMKRKEDERKRREEEERKWKEEVERAAKEKEKERKLEEERRRQEEILRAGLLALLERDGKERQEEEWLRGDVFKMTTMEPEEPDLIPAPIPKPPSANELTVERIRELEEDGEEWEEWEDTVVPNRGGLPQGCDISDVIVTCENVKLLHFPPLSIPELKSLNLEGNNISSIPAETFNGIPNLEWINLRKNKLTSAGIDPKAFRGLKNLRRLYLDGNLLESVPAYLPPTLQELKISENKLRRIDVNSFKDLSSLVILEMEGNLLSEGNVDHRAFAPLVQLSYLRLGRNHFRTVPQGLPASLLELYLENNLIEEISDNTFNQTKNLNVISLRHNKLDESRIAPLAWFHHRSLESIDLSHNDLYLVPSYLPISLVHLVLVGNHIERIPGYVFAHMDPGLEYLYLSYNRLDGHGVEPESFFGTYDSMVELCLDHNQLVIVPSGINEMTNLHFLRLNNNRIRSVPEEGICDPDFSGDPTLVTLRLENNYLDPQKISPKAFTCVRASSSVTLKPQNNVPSTRKTKN